MTTNQRGILTPLHPEEVASPQHVLHDALLRHNIFHFSIGEGASKEATPSRCHPTPLPQAIMLDIGAPGIPNQGAPAGAEQPKEPVEPPADTHPPAPAVAPSELPPEIPSSASHATPQPPPVIPPPSAPSPSAELRVAIPILEYRGLSHTYQALATSQSIITQQITTLHSQQE
ncbi:hypothetical protein CK203_050326 [Vitis vinifera]|uniref:Uncharacterized protein n=1 Tax=Vitis vinifera TaxID=29760 RepID=A0A438GZM1_VITVI|nr:hypothetical protein CK203_050326 [Vitis vinifera]